MKSLETQVGGSHYQDCKIQPVEFIRANELNFCEGNVVKYTVRRKNSRIEDLKKARHYVDMLIEDELAALEELRGIVREGKPTETYKATP